MQKIRNSTSGKNSNGQHGFEKKAANAVSVPSISDVSTIGPELPSNSYECPAQLEKQILVSGSTMFTTGFQSYLEGNTLLLENCITRGNYDAMSLLGDDLSSKDLKFVQSSVIVEELAFQVCNLPVHQGWGLSRSKLQACLQLTIKRDYGPRKWN